MVDTGKSESNFILENNFLAAVSLANNNLDTGNINLDTQLSEAQILDKVIDDVFIEVGRET